MLYHKIQSLYLRDPSTNHKTFLDGQWSTPEFGYLKDVEWNWTEKVDGTNIRVIWDGQSVSFGGRTDNAQIHAGLVNALQKMFPANHFADFFDGPVVLFGEGYGEKIQKGGGNYRIGQSFVLFDAWCGGMWLRRYDVAGIGAKLLCSVTPEVGSGTLLEAVEYVKSAPRSRWGKFTAEGIVMRPAVELQTRRGDRVIAKLKVKDFK